MISSVSLYYYGTNGMWYQCSECTLTRERVQKVPSLTGQTGNLMLSTLHSTRYRRSALK